MRPLLILFASLVCVLSLLPFPAPAATTPAPAPSPAGTLGTQAITFTLVPGALPALSYTAAAWGDYDSDGDLDVVLTGMGESAAVSSCIFRNDGGVFTDIGAGLPGVYRGAVAWGDYDNDSDLDLAFTGDTNTGSCISRIYRNDGGTFTDIGAGLPGVVAGSVAWGDCDNDGDLDLLLMGSTGAANVTNIYINDGHGGFTDMGAGLEPASGGSAAWGDYDKDGDLDLLITGNTAAVRITRIYRNDGASGFTDAAAGLPGLNRSTAVWGDFDSDGDLDIALTGNADSGFQTRVYRLSSGTYYHVPAAIASVGWSMAAWADYDHDGDLDLLVSGDGSTNDFARIYRYDGGNTFTDIGAPFLGVEQGSVGWADFDHDGDLDVLLTGYSYGGPRTLLYRSDGAPANTKPTTPTGLTSSAAGRTLTLNWNASTDAQTPSTGLSYNLRVGTTPGGNEIMSPMTVSSLGWRLVGGMGNAQQRLSWTIRVPIAGTYYWSVQAIDGAFAGSEFPPTQTAYANVSFSYISGGLVDVASGASAWGDFDNDNDLDLVITGGLGLGNYTSRVYRNDGGGAFTDIGAGLAGVDGAVAWGDLDGDEDLDLILTGIDSSGQPVTHVYLRTGGPGEFAEIASGLPNVYSSSLALGNFDDDGDLDVLLAGHDGTAGVTDVWRNDGTGHFTAVAAGLPAVWGGSVSWADFDGDGDLDIQLSGLTSPAGGRITRLFENDGTEGFSDINAGLTAVGNGASAWADFDKDGDLDLLLAGMRNTLDGITRLCINNGGHTFTEVDIGLPGIITGSATWGDYDNDGDLDLALMGGAGPDGFSRIYRNDGGWTFTDIGAGLYGFSSGTAAWGDFDGDDDLDLLLVGSVGATWWSRIYVAEGAPPNTPPTAPTGLTTSVSDQRVTFSWDAASDAETPAGSLTYNVRVGSAPGTANICSPMSSPVTGIRRVVQPGNSGARRSWTMELPSGSYYWSVQAVDGAYRGSLFSGEDEIVPVLASLVSAEAGTGRVRLTWQVSAGVVAPVEVHRRTARSGWTAVASVRPDGTGYVRFEDEAVEPGARYGYRLVIRHGAAYVTVGEAWVEVPRALAFALDGARPNPAGGGALLVQFTLPSTERARLELLDPQGRRVAVHELAAAGRHIVDLGRQTRLAPGIYLLRLTQGHRIQVAKAVVLD